MRSLSVWAKFNPRKARAFIVILKCSLAILAFLISRWSRQQYWNLHPPLLMAISSFCFIGAMAAYPDRSTHLRSRKYFYIHQKTCDFVLASSTFLIMIGVLNSPNTSRMVTPTAAMATTRPIEKQNEATRILATLEHRDRKSLSRHEKRILKHELGNQLKLYAHEKLMGQNEKAEQAALIILTIIVTIGLLVALAALSCSIACGGAEGLALLVFLAGVVGLTLGTIAVIKSISRKGRRKKIEPDTTPPIRS